VHGIGVLSDQIVDHRFARFTRISTQRFDTSETAGCSGIQVDGIHYLSYGTQSIPAIFLRLVCHRAGLMGVGGDGGSGVGGNRTGGGDVVGQEYVGDDGGGGGSGGCDGGNSFPMLT